MKMPESEQLTQNINLRFTPSEYDMIQSASELYHLNVSEYLLSLINGRDGIRLRNRNRKLRLRRINPFVPLLSDNEAWTDLGSVCAYKTATSECINPLTKNRFCLVMNGKCRQCPGYVRSRS